MSSRGAEQSQPTKHPRQREHEAKGYEDRRRIEIGICAFLGRRIGEPAWCVPVSEVQWFIRHSPDYLPLLDALEAVHANNKSRIT